MTSRFNRQEVLEQFTFRHGDAAYTVDDAVIDTGTQRTEITQAIVDALGLQPLGKDSVAFTDDAGAPVTIYRCIVAWTIYEHQGYYSLQDVFCIDRSTEVIIGFDFLAHHELSIDMGHRGLVGTAPANAQPLLGGGYVVNAPRSFILDLNRARSQEAASGTVFRPHPAWRFTRPAIVKS